MTDFCSKCGICCRLIPIDNESKMLLRDGIQEPDQTFLDSLYPLSIESACNINESYVKKVQNIFPEAQFYSCKYLSDENICTNSNMPSACKNFPSHPLAIIPDDCGYEGDIFIKNEQLKQKIRKLKEEIIHYEALIASGDKDKNSYAKIIANHTKFIDKYALFKAWDW